MVAQKVPLGLGIDNPSYIVCVVSVELGGLWYGVARSFSPCPQRRRNQAAFSE